MWRLIINNSQARNLLLIAASRKRTDIRLRVPYFISVNFDKLVVIIFQTFIFVRHEMRQSLERATQIRSSHVFAASGDFCSIVLHFIVLNDASKFLIRKILITMIRSSCLSFIQDATAYSSKNYTSARRLPKWARSLKECTSGTSHKLRQFQV